ncbi:MAG: sugar transferase, partial [Lachnospiraceae bacterium]|nr:sugar transferase [Lachnospiraceae bacterium]
MKLENIKHDLTLPAVKGLNVLSLTVTFFWGWSMFYAGFMGSTALKWTGYILSGLFFSMYALFGKVYDAFMISTNRISELVYSQALAAIISDGMMYVIICLLMRRWMNPMWMVCVFVVQMVLAVIWCIGAHRWYFASFPARRSAVVYDIRRGMDQLIREYGMDKKFDVQLKVHAEECVKNPDMLKGMEAVFLSGVHSHERNILLKYCIINSISVYVIPRIGDILMSGTKPVHMFHLPILRAERYNPPLGYLIAKRTFDIVAAGLALIVTSPIFLLTAIAIKREDGGPVFYK